MAEMQRVDRWRYPLPPRLQRQQYGFAKVNSTKSKAIPAAVTSPFFLHDTTEVTEDNNNSNIHPTKILVRNVKNLCKQEIHTFFSKFGTVCLVEKWVKSNTALVRFHSPLVASTVLNAQLADLTYGGRQLFVEKRHLPKRGKLITPVRGVLDYSCNVEEDMTTIHCLPDEILQHIFTFLTPKQRIRTERVCKYWRALGKDVPWRGLSKLVLDSEQSPEYYQLTDKMVEAILSRCGLTLKQFTLNRYRCSVEFLTLKRAMEYICRFCPNLVELKLVSVPVEDADLLSLSLKAKNLKNVAMQHTDFSEAALAQFLSECQHLECLDINNNDNISGQCFSSLGTNFKVLNVKCFSLDNSIGKILNSSCNQLQDLKLIHCHLVEAEVLVQVFHKYRKTLKVLHLDGYVGDIEWASCLKTLQVLEDLSLDECSNVDDQLLSVLAKSCPKLKALNVGATNVTDRGLYSLASAPCLKSLDISYSDSVLGEGVAALAAQGKLEEVYIRSNLEVNDGMCQSFAEFCTNLRILDVSESPEITDALVGAFRASLETGVLHGPIKLIVGGTGVTEEVESCDKLELVFENTSRRELCSIDDYTDDDDSDFDYYSYNSGYDSYYDYDSDMDNPFDEPFLFIWD